MEPLDGIDGPYSVPFKMQEQTVKAEWIDYNGHMNVAYYTLAFDLSLDEFFENILGLGPSYVARSKSGPYSLQAQYHYLDELLQGERFYVKVYVRDFNAKCLHIVMEMIHSKKNTLTAVCEQVLINVDLNTRRSVEYPDWAQERIRNISECFSNEIFPSQAGSSIGLRKKNK